MIMAGQTDLDEKANISAALTAAGDTGKAPEDNSGKPLTAQVEAMAVRDLTQKDSRGNVQDGEAADQEGSERQPVRRDDARHATAASADRPQPWISSSGSVAIWPSIQISYV